MSTVPKITFPPTTPGGGQVRIRLYFDGKLSGPAMVAGHAVRDARGWEATLWPGLNEPPTPASSKLRASTLNGLRSVLLQRIGCDGAWWE